MKRRRAVPLVALMLAIALAAGGCRHQPPTRTNPEPPPGQTGSSSEPAVLEPAPDFTVTDLDGSTLRLADARGKIVVLYFWATYCKPCIEKLPNIQALQEAYGDKGVEIWALSLDPDVQMVKGWLQQHDLATPIAMAGSEVTEKFFPGKKLLPIPEAIIVNPQGKIARRMGTDLTVEEIEATINELLSGTR